MELNEIQRYIVEEHVEEFDAGVMSRRELLRRVTRITGSTATALVVLAALGCDLSRPAATASPAAAPAAASPSPAAAPTSPQPQVGYATPPPAATTDGVTVKPDDPRIVAQKIDVPGADYAAMTGYLARPRADGKHPAVLVVHENAGLVEHIRDVVRRLATAGFVGLSIDLLSRQGGAEKLGATYSAELGKRPVESMVTDLVAALIFLNGQPFVAADRLGVVGFCFGGGMVWSLLDFGAPLRAAVPYYGPTPSKSEGIAKTKAAVFAVYAENDSRVNAGRGTAEELLKRSGTTYQITAYPGVGHAFHNDTRQSGYGAEQAQKAWVATIEWLRKFLA